MAEARGLEDRLIGGQRQGEGRGAQAEDLSQLRAPEGPPAQDHHVHPAARGSGHSPHPGAEGLRKGDRRVDGPQSRLKLRQRDSLFVGKMRRSLLPGTGNRTQIGQIAAPDRGGVLGLTAGAGEKGGVDQLAVIEDRQSVCGVHGGLRPGPSVRRYRGRIQPALAAGRVRADRRALVPPPVIAAQCVGAAGHGLGLAGLLREARRQLRQQDAGEIGPQIQTDDLPFPQDRQEIVPVKGLWRLQLRPGVGSRRSNGGLRWDCRNCPGRGFPAAAYRQREQNREGDSRRRG